MYPALLRYAMRFGLGRHAADDVVQETFLRLWRDRGTIVVRVSMSAMLYTMVRNRALNVKRDTKRIASDVEVDDGLQLSRHNVDVEDEIDAGRLQKILYSWIDDLPARRGEAFVLSRFHDLSHASIAAIMGLSKRTVDTHIVLALRELRVRLDKLQNQESEL
jgi:RNA polymerase sigma-70 factor (ECF subfamily)